MLTAIKAKTTRILSIRRQPDALLLVTENGQMRITPYAEDILRIEYALGEPDAEVFPEKSSPGIVAGPAALAWTCEETPTHIRFRTSRLQVEILRASGAFRYLDENGIKLVEEPEAGGKTLFPFDSFRTVFDADSVVEKVETPDGWKDVVREAKRVWDRTLYRARLHFRFSKEEALYGLGSHEEGTLNLRGTRQYVHQANMKSAMPFLVSTNGYGVLMDTYAPLLFNDNAYGSYLYTHAAERMDYYFIHGRTPADVVRRYRALTGKAPLIPLWALGYIQSQERYETQQELLDTVLEYRRRQIPLDCIVLDWQSWEEGLWGQKSFDAARFPDPKGLMDALHAQGARLMISIWPNMAAECPDHLEMRDAGCLLPQSDLYNAFSEEARALYWEQAQRGLFSSGMDAWWCDSSEPFTPEWNVAVKPEPDVNLLDFHQTASRYLPEQMTNAYPLMHARTMYEGQRAATGQKRVVNLTRSGYTGSQRYGVILWSGDTSAKWSSLKKQIPAGLQACASGIPYWTLDIGAFFVRKGHMWFWDGDFEAGNDDLGYRELYVRWFQYGAFLPVFRAHGTDTRRDVWQFGQEGEPFYDSLVAAARLRYRLIPYLYSCAAQVTFSDDTVMRPLAFDFPHDPSTFDIRDQYLLGPGLMVCPVTEPMYHAPGSVPLTDTDKTRPVYLPAGSDWFDFHTGVPHAGGQTIRTAAPLDRIPLFVRAGTILPMAEPALHTDAIRRDRLSLHVYPGADGCFRLYQDAGDGYGYEAGESAFIDITWEDHSGTLTFQERKGAYPGMPERMTFQLSGLWQGVRSVTYQGDTLWVRMG